jgi:hypothetical protein
VFVPQAQPYVLVTIVPFLAKMIKIVGNAVWNARVACIVEVEHADLVPQIVIQGIRERKNAGLMDVVVYVARAVITRYASMIIVLLANLADPHSFAQPSAGLSLAYFFF